MTQVIVALDVDGEGAALRLLDRMGDRADFVKVGLELFVAEGPSVVRTLRDRGLRVFLDLKLLDIPNTVAGAVRSAAGLGVDLLTIHASGGRAMLRAACAALPAGDAPPPPRLLAVTVLTSLSGPEGEDPEGKVLRLARMAVEEGIPGVVASPREAAALRRALGPRALIVTPGIRLPGDARDDQSRVATPAEAVAAGATHIVVGRSVTAAPDPAARLDRIRGEVERASASLRPQVLEGAR